MIRHTSDSLANDNERDTKRKRRRMATCHDWRKDDTRNVT